MPRQTTAHYLAVPSTRFAWATDDNDKFNRELDLYNLAQAVENHDHSAGRGLPVGASAIGANSVDGAAIKANSISSHHIVDGQVTRVDIANNAIDNSKMDYPRVLVSGDTMTGDLTLTRTASSLPNQGQLNFGTGTQFIRFDGTRFIWQSNTGVPNLHIGDLTVCRNEPNTHRGAIRFDLNGTQVLEWTGTPTNKLLFRNYPVMTEETHGNLLNLFSLVTPVGGLMMVESMSIMNGMNAAYWERDTRFDGRMPVGNGNTTWGYFVDNTAHGAPWAAVGTGGTILGSRTTDSAGNPTVYLMAPSRIVVFARRKA